MEFIELLKEANKEIRKELGKDVKVITNSYCCGSCTWSMIYNQGYKNYIAWELYRNGMNKNVDYFDKNYWRLDTRFRDYDKKEGLYANWNLSDEQLKKALKILRKYFKVKKPTDISECIQILSK